MVIAACHDGSLAEQLEEGEIVLDGEPRSWRMTARIYRGNLELRCQHWLHGTKAWNRNTALDGPESRMTLSTLETSRLRELLVSCHRDSGEAD